MVEPMVSLRRVTRRFGDRVAVEDLTLDVAPGEAVALLGANGAGKTTTLEMLLGLLRPDEGVVRVLGTTPRAAIGSGAVGAMLQVSGLPSRATVTELVALTRRLHPRPLPLAEALAVGDLEAIDGRWVEDLSGGEQQRVRLALALAGGPRLLVLDEPTAAMDLPSRRSFWGRVREYVGAGRSIVFATHQLEEADDVADRVVVLSKGRLVADASPDALGAAGSKAAAVRFKAGRIPLEALARLPAVERVEVERGHLTLHTIDAERTVRVLLERFPEVADLSVARGGLEDAFLALADKVV